ncbi:MAG TPA: deoxyguanosinetriphosphate triphosphohydrolase [Candidatus Eisenbacteria bacterium]|nr:deoxyguanosinetriphosphate triphosphohydrolase [Candidatus Eisenbacteria bacterium]
MLAPYAARVEDSRRRRHPEPPHPYRNAFQRDRDRIIHARAFRRLENKTQVFTRRYSDHFRTRLTHTMEVAQISRTIAAALDLNVDLTEALALVHDIGHPPFGHAGERALDAAMHRHGEYFDHNLQALRIVEDFELRYAEFRGLNLTFEVREGIIKHSHHYTATEHPELAEYLLDLQPPLEAQLIDLTDEIAYTTADLDDGYEAKLLKLADVRKNVRAFERFYVAMEAKYPDAPDKLKFNEALKRMLNGFVTDLIDNTRSRILQSGVKSLEDVRRYPERLVAFSPAIQKERREAKAYLYRTLYESKPLQPEKLKAEKIVTETFDYFVAHPEALPHSYQEKVAHEKLVRVVCDYIAGMTDHYVQEVWKKLVTV